MTKIECPNCKRRALAFVQEQVACKNCRTTFDAKGLFDTWSVQFADKARDNHIFRSLYDKFVRCPYCHETKLMCHTELKQWLCFGCFKTWHEDAIKFCEYCKSHEETRYFHRVGACNMCWKYYNNHEKYRVPVVIPDYVLKNFDLNKDKLFY